MTVGVSSSTCATLLKCACSPQCDPSLRVQSVTAGIRLNGTLSQRRVAFCRHFALYTRPSGCRRFTLSRPPPFSRPGLSRSFVNTSCWCEPRLHFPLLFQSKIETKPRQTHRTGRQRVIKRDEQSHNIQSPPNVWPLLPPQHPNYTHSSLSSLPPPIQLPLLPPQASLIGQRLKPRGGAIARRQPRTESRSH